MVSFLLGNGPPKQNCTELSHILLEINQLPRLSTLLHLVAIPMLTLGSNQATWASVALFGGCRVVVRSLLSSGYWTECNKNERGLHVSVTLEEPGRQPAPMWHKSKCLWGGYKASTTPQERLLRPKSSCQELMKGTSEDQTHLQNEGWQARH